MKNKKIVMIGLIVILIAGLVSVFATQNKSWYGHKGWKKSGEYTHKNFEDKSAWFEKMGLSEDATEEEIIAAKKELWAQKGEYSYKEKLGLSDDASEEEVKEAWQEWKENNEFHSKKHYFGKSSWCSKS